MCTRLLLHRPRTTYTMNDKWLDVEDDRFTHPYIFPFPHYFLLSYDSYLHTDVRVCVYITRTFETYAFPLSAIHIYSFYARSYFLLMYFLSRTLPLIFYYQYFLHAFITQVSFLVVNWFVPFFILFGNTRRLTTISYSTLYTRKCAIHIASAHLNSLT